MSIIFVFGSNLAGRHGAGAAKHARERYGAEYGVGEGPTGFAYAIPTKDAELKTLPVEAVAAAIERFARYAETFPGDVFLLTPVGTGLAGLPKREIWAAAKAARLPPNVALTSSWLD